MDQHSDRISISVVITAYNAALWINQTLDSILKQTYPVAEVIVVDDGSNDETAKIVRGYGPPVIYLYQDNSGQPVARNRGIRAASGNFIAFVDADDYWHPRKLEAQAGLIRSQNLEWVICEGEYVNSTGKPISMPVPPMAEGDVLEKLILGNFITSATPVLSKAVLEKVGYFNEDPEARIGEDWDMWMRVASHYTLGVVREKLAYIRTHASSMMSVTAMQDKVKALEGVVLRAVNREPHRLAHLKKEALASIYYRTGVQLMKQNAYKDARQYFLQELRYRPFKTETLVYFLFTLLGPALSGPFIQLKRSIWK